VTAAIELVELVNAVELVQPASTVELAEPSVQVEISEPTTDVELVEQTTTIELDNGSAIELVEQVIILELGSAALQGPPGSSGGGSGASYTHTQSVAATDWTVNHNLGYLPKAVQVVDSGGNVWLGEIQHTNTSSLVIRFGFPFTGTATVG
jgi:hypothetical protein